MDERRFPLDTALLHPTAKALVKAGLVSRAVLLVVLVPFAALGAAIVIDLVGWAWHTDLESVALLAVGAGMIGIGTWGSVLLLYSRNRRFPIVMSLTRSGILLDYPDGSQAGLLWADPNFLLELREVRVPAMRRSGPFLNVEWNEPAPGQRFPRHIHAIVERVAFDALKAEATIRGFSAERLVTEVPPSASTLFRAPTASRPVS